MTSKPKDGTINQLEEHNQISKFRLHKNLKQNEMNREKREMEYRWVMWQAVALSVEQSHLTAGLKYLLSKIVESMAAPLQGSPLMFHGGEDFSEAVFPHRPSIAFSAATARSKQIMRLILVQFTAPFMSPSNSNEVR